MITPAQGARGQIDACIGDAWEGISGKYVAEQSGPGGSEVGPGGKKGVFKVTESSKYSYDQEAAARLCAASKAEANANWARGEYAKCAEQLSVSIGVNSRCDVLRRYRAKAASRQGDDDAAVRDAQRAVALNASGGRNHAALASASTSRTTQTPPLPLPCLEHNGARRHGAA